MRFSQLTAQSPLATPERHRANDFKCHTLTPTPRKTNRFESQIQIAAKRARLDSNAPPPCLCSATATAPSVARPRSPAAPAMETLMVDRVHSSLRLFMHRNAVFLCERLCAQFPSEVPPLASLSLPRLLNEVDWRELGVLFVGNGVVEVRSGVRSA